MTGWWEGAVYESMPTGASALPAGGLLDSGAVARE